MKIEYRKSLLSIVSLAACLFTNITPTFANQTFANKAFASVSLDLDSIITEDDAMGDKMLVKDLQPFQLTPSATLKAYGGKFYSANAQALWPFFTYSQSANIFGIFEGDFTFKSKSGWYAGAGLGYRRVINNSYIGGAYLLGDYLSSNSKHAVWVVNPGIEILGYSWDFRTNGYVSLGAKHWHGDAVWADEIGIYDYTQFTSHEQYNVKFRSYEEAGYGVDAELGLQIPYLTNPKIYAGGYYYNRGNKLGDIGGVEGRFVYPCGPYFAIEGRASYDNEKSTTLLLGVRFSLGGFTNDQKANFGVAGRLSDPIEHNFAAFDNGSPIPITQSYDTDGVELLERDHIVFVKPEAGGGMGAGSGTYEDPYYGFDQTRMDIIELDPAYQQYVNIYFASGGYDLGASFSNTLLLPANVALFGRQNDYRAPATGNNRATFLGEFDFDSVSKNDTIDSIILYNLLGDPSRIGINIDGSQSITFNNVQVGELDVVDNYQYKTAVQLNNATAINFANSSIFAYADEGVGINLQNNSVLNLNGGNNVTASFDDSFVTGVRIDNTSTLNLNGVEGNANTILASALNLGFDPIGIFNDGTLNINSYNSIKGFSQYTSAAGIINSDVGTVNVLGNYNVISASVGTSTASASLSSNSDNDDNNSSSNRNSNSKKNRSSLNGFGLLGVPSQPQVIGIYSGGGAVNVAGSNNEISAYGTSLVLGAFLLTNNTTLTISGAGNNIIASTNFGLSSYGIYSSQSIVNITGNNNQVLAHTNNGAIGAAIEAYDSNEINISGSNNTFLADGSATNYLTGIDLLLGSTLNVGTVANPAATTGNVIAGGSTAGGGASDSGVSGVRVSGAGSEANVIGTQNKITAIATGGSGNAMGVAVQDEATLRLSGTGNEITATTVAGSSGEADGLSGAAKTNIYISGSSNKITGTSISGYGNGIMLEGGSSGVATLSISGSNNAITGTAQSSGAVGSGIKAVSNSAVTINNTASKNTITGNNSLSSSLATVTNNATAADMLGIPPPKPGSGNGITLDNSTLFEMGSENIIAGNSAQDANGIWSNNSTVSVVGSGTKINAISSGGGIASGVYSGDSHVFLSGSIVTADSLKGKVHGLDISGTSSIVSLQNVVLNLGHLKTTETLFSPTEVLGVYLQNLANASAFFATNTNFNIIGEGTTVMWGVASAAGVDATSATRLKGGGNFFSTVIYDPSKSPAIDTRVDTAPY